MVVITNPLWLMKTRLQLQGNPNDSANKRGRYRGLVDTITTMYREEGLSGFYKGFLPALLLTSHGAVQVQLFQLLFYRFNI